MGHLAADLAPLTVERLDLGRLAGARDRDEPGHRWWAYKEAFSPVLVRHILDNWTGLEGPVLDPFAGTGTSIMVANERNLSAVGVELLAYPQWAANTAIRAKGADADRLRELVHAAAKAGHQGGDGQALPAPAASWALSVEVTRALLAIRRAIGPRGTSVEVDLAHLALLSGVEAVSTSVKDGTSLRHRDRQRDGQTTRPGRKGLEASAHDVIEKFQCVANLIIDDLPKLPAGDATGAVIRADARQLPLADASVGCAIFSPPYPNRYDYSSVYQLELAVGGFVRSPDELRAVRKSLLRSHLEAPPPLAPTMADPGIVALLQSVATAAAAGTADAGRTLRMLVGYFDDMAAVLEGLARVLRPGAPAACVVATQTYFGTAVPTDIMIASLAQRAGLIVEGIWVLRHKRVAVQQRSRGVLTSRGGHESIVYLRRPA